MSYRDALLGIAKFIDQRTGLDLAVKELEQHPWLDKVQGPVGGRLYRALVFTASRLGQERLVLLEPFDPSMSLGEMATVLLQTTCHESDPAKFPDIAHWRSCKQHASNLQVVFSNFAAYLGMAAGLVPTDMPVMDVFTCGNAGKPVGPVAGSEPQLIFLYERQLKDLFAGTSAFTEAQREKFIEAVYAYHAAYHRPPREKSLAALKQAILQSRKM